MLTNLKSRALRSRKKHKRLFQKLSRLKATKVDSMFREADEEAFNCIDCLECANCCRTTGPLFTRRDIDRIATYLGLSKAEFESKYLKVDEDEDFVLSQLPCPFLDLSDNKCTIYDVRPRACADYPHTHQNDQLKLKRLTLKNATICPAVLDILDRVEKKLEGT